MAFNICLLRFMFISAFITSNQPSIYRCHNPPTVGNTSWFVLSNLLPTLPVSLLCPRRPVLFRASHRAAVFALVLLSGIEPNPGPVNVTATGAHCLSKVGGLQGALLNTRSAVNKAALLHDTINSFNLDFLVLTETWLWVDDPRSILQD